MKMNCDTSIFRSDLGKKDLRDITIIEDGKYPQAYSRFKQHDNNISINLNYLGKEILCNDIKRDADNNNFYIPSELTHISIYEAKCRLLNNQIDNYTTSTNANLMDNDIDPYLYNGLTSAMIYTNKEIGIKKRNALISTMKTSPEDYKFIAKVKNKRLDGLLGSNGEFIEYNEIPIDVSKVKYYDNIKECIKDSLMFSYINNGFPLYKNDDVFLAVPKDSIISK